MRLLSNFNYAPDAHYSTMLKAWLYCAENYAPNLERVIIVDSARTEAINYLERIKKAFTFTIQLCKYAPEPIKAKKSPVFPLWHHNINFKLWNNCQQTEPFIFIDLDAFLIADPTPMITASLDKPFIGIEQEYVTKYSKRYKNPFFNGGVQIVSDPHFLDFEAIRKAYELPLHAPGAEQAIMLKWFDAIGYNWQHPAISYEWNSWAGYCQIKPDNSVWSTYPRGPHPVSIIHYWWVHKPWTMPSPWYELAKTL